MLQWEQRLWPKHVRSTGLLNRGPTLLPFEYHCFYVVYLGHRITDRVALQVFFQANVVFGRRDLLKLEAP